MDIKVPFNHYVDSNLQETIVHRTGRLPMRIYHENEVYYHWHEEYEFILNLEPAMCVVDGTSYRLMPEDAILVEQHELHARYSDRTGSNSLISIVIHPDLINGNEDFGTDLPRRLHFNRFLSHSNPGEKEIIDLLHQLVEIDRERGFGFEYRMQAVITAVFSLMIRYHLYTEVSDSNESAMSAQFRNLLTYIYENYPQPITLDDLSEISHYSKHYIIKLFHENTLMTPIEYIKNYRLLVAQRKLRHTTKSITEVAESCGIPNLSYFTRSFKALTGVTPLAFRKNQQIEIANRVNNAETKIADHE